MKLVKKLFIFISSLFTYSFLTLPAFADDTTNVSPCSSTATGIAKTLCDLGGVNITRTIQNIVIFFIVLAIIIALMYLLYGGVKWIMSRGEKTEVEAARNHIMAAIIGLIVVFLAIFIVSIILKVFGLDITNLTIPTLNN
jgi:uncharacterized protein YacL